MNNLTEKIERASKDVSIKALEIMDNYKFNKNAKNSELKKLCEENKFLLDYKEKINHRLYDFIYNTINA